MNEFLLFLMKIILVVGVKVGWKSAITKKITNKIIINKWKLNLKNKMIIIIGGRNSSAGSFRFGQALG